MGGWGLVPYSQTLCSDTGAPPNRTIVERDNDSSEMPYSKPIPIGQDPPPPPRAISTLTIKKQNENIHTK